MAHPLDIIVNVEDVDEESERTTPESALVTWVTHKVKDWEEHRRSNYDNKWDEYFRLWKGIWDKSDKLRKSERSRLIGPALQQAVEVGAAEIEEALFGKGRWFDVTDDYMDQVNQQDTDIEPFRNVMKEDMETAGYPDAISEIILNSCIYGTGIGKILVDTVSENKITEQEIGFDASEPAIITESKIQVKLEPILPKNFAIDPTARSIDEAMGVAHIYVKSKHAIKARQQAGTYLSGDLGGMNEIHDLFDYASRKETKPITDTDTTKIVEYHGKVPRSLLDKINEVEGEEIVELFGAGDDLIENDILIEAIVIIANDNKLLKGVENPVLNKDRAIIAFPYDKVPNRFFGRGICEKGYNPQKALDSELRARIDAMAISVHPMMAIDATRVPRGADFSVRPGKTLLTNGDPRTVLMPFTFGQVNPVTFSQSGELERMIQMGTGSMDSAAPTGVSPRNNTASGMSMILSGAIKRSKRTLANMERNFIIPLINKTAWRYIQFAPDRYPARDVKFIVVSTLGIMAREIEQQNLSNLLKTVPAESPAFWMLIRGIYEMSNITDKEVMLQIIDQMMMKSLNPEPDPMQQQLQQIQIEQITGEIKKTKSETMENMAQIQKLLTDIPEDDTIKQRLEAELKFLIAEKDNETKEKIALIGAHKDLKIKAMELASQPTETETDTKEPEKDSNINISIDKPASRKVSIERGTDGKIIGANITEGNTNG